MEKGGGAGGRGGFFFIWTLLTMGATGLVAFVLSVRAIWSLRQRRRASA